MFKIENITKSYILFKKKIIWETFLKTIAVVENKYSNINNNSYLFWPLNLELTFLFCFKYII